jgi:hypothetical protein
MIYEVRYEINGRDGKKGVRASAGASEQEVLDQFRKEWEECGDTAPVSAWISGSWTES